MGQRMIPFSHIMTDQTELKQLMKATEPQVAQITLFNLSFITEPIHCPNLRQLCNGLDVGYL